LSSNATIHGIDSDYRRRLRIWLGSFAVVILFGMGIYRLVLGNLSAGAIDFAAAAALALLVGWVRYGGGGEGVGLAMAAVTTAATSALVTSLGAEGIAWSFPAVIATFSVTSRPRAVLVSAAGIAYVAYAMHTKSTADVAITYFLSLTLVGIITWVALAHFEQLQARLEILASVDPLTGAENRRALNEWMQLEDQHQAGSAIAIIDLDHFKSINDTHGHAAGDRVLIETAGLIRALMKPSDRLFRVGGEEFLVVMPGVGRHDAQGLADLILTAIPQKVRTRNASVTASIGLAHSREGEATADWVARADKALYSAKGQGRNRVQIDS